MTLKVSRIIVALGAVSAASSAFASGYNVKLGSGWTAGMANAGSGVTDDALAIYANPAAMIQNMTHQIAGQATGVFGKTTFRGTNSLPETGKTKNAAKKIAVPSFGVVANAHERLKLGLMVHSPFGLKFNYRNSSITRAHATRAEMTTVNIVPSFALKLTDFLSFGAGLQMQYTKVELARKVAITNANSIYSLVSGNEWAMGWTAGLFAQVTKAWKVGLSYKSQMSTDIHGHGQLGTLASPTSTDTFSSHAKIYFPHITTLSTSYDLNNCWTAFMDVIYTKWDKVKNITITNFRSAGTSQEILPLNWRNSWFGSIGLNYRLNENWSFRGGYAYDTTPTRNSTRVVSIPDANKHWVAIGTTYNMGKNFALTLSYGHEFFSKGKINLTTNQGLKGTLVGKVKNKVDLVSLQFNYKF